MTDIVERLREFGTEQSLYPLCTEAADEIERLTAALRELIEAWDSLPTGNYTPSTIHRWLNGEKMKRGIETARAALARREGKP